MKCVRSFDWNWVAGIRKNKKVNCSDIIENLDILDKGLRCHLRGYGWVTVFRFVRNELSTDYITTITTNVENPTLNQIENIIKMRWNIEVYHRELKQTCGIECCISCSGLAQRNHICITVLSWIYRFKKHLVELTSFYRQQWLVIKNSITANMQLILA